MDDGHIFLVVCHLLTKPSLWRFLKGYISQVQQNESKVEQVTQAFQKVSNLTLSKKLEGNDATIN
jgi:hypothetical protein